MWCHTAYTSQVQLHNFYSVSPWGLAEAGSVNSWVWTAMGGLGNPQQSAGVCAPASCQCSSWEAAVMAQVMGFLSPSLETWMEFPAPGLEQACMGPLESEPWWKPSTLVLG